MKLIAKPELPKEIFKVEVPPQLISQSVRVFLANQRQGNQSALTRAEVNKTRKKFQKQKGTGNARHGDRKAPIFVGGGIAFAPKPRDYSLSFPSKMKKLSLFGTLSLKLSENKLNIVSDAAKLSGKTAEMADFVATLSGKSNKLLIVTDVHRDNVYRAGRNIPGITIVPVNQLNSYEVLKADQIILMEEAIMQIGKTESKKPSNSKEEIVEKVSKTPKVVTPKKIIKKPTIKKTVKPKK